MRTPRLLSLLLPVLAACDGSSDTHGTVDPFYGQPPDEPVIEEPVPAPPRILSGPADLEVLEGELASFTVSATGAPPLSFQWQRDGIDLAGATSSTLTFTAALANDGAIFRALISNGAGTTASSTAALSV